MKFAVRDVVSVQVLLSSWMDMTPVSFCLGHGHAETVIEGSGCPHCEEMSFTALCFQCTIVFGNTMATNMLPPSTMVELQRKKQRLLGRRAHAGPDPTCLVFT
ncbi:hypothetical protein QQF64_006528 [Cirrhinus molitorella]|uniref:Secreted protein n=1 Tax=Cirrhinus molitorella TaxID=172907 RepID=A0ABR3M807_9TELE